MPLGRETDGRWINNIVHAWTAVLDEERLGSGVTIRNNWLHVYLLGDSNGAQKIRLVAEGVGDVSYGHSQPDPMARFYAVSDNIRLGRYRIENREGLLVMR